MLYEIYEYIGNITLTTACKINQTFEGAVNVKKHFVE